MLTLLLRPVLLLTLGLLLPIAIIRAQSFDDRDLRALLSPPGCEPPCFMGIRPGISTSAETLSILNALPWVHSVRSELTYFRPELTESIYWEWHSDDPHWFDPTTQGEIHLSDNRVRWIGVATRIPLGDIWQTYDAPHTATLLFNPRVAKGLIFYEGVYPTVRLHMTLFVTCPARDFWQQPTIFTWTDYEVERDALPADKLALQVRDKCRL